MADNRQLSFQITFDTKSIDKTLKQFSDNINGVSKNVEKLVAGRMAKAFDSVDKSIANSVKSVNKFGNAVESSEGDISDLSQKSLKLRDTLEGVVTSSEKAGKAISVKFRQGASVVEASMRKMANNIKKGFEPTEQEIKDITDQIRYLQGMAGKSGIGFVKDKDVARAKELGQSLASISKIDTDLTFKTNLDSLVKDFQQLEKSASKGDLFGKTTEEARALGVKLQQLIGHYGNLDEAIDSVAQSSQMSARSIQSMRSQASKLSGSLDRLDAELSKSAGGFNKLRLASARASKGFGVVSNSAIKTLYKLQFSLSSVTNGIQGFVLALGGLYAIKGTLDLVSELETLKLTVKELSPSMEAFGKNWKFIQDFARTTPMTMASVTEAFIQFQAYGLDPTERSMRAVVDAVAALGGGRDTLTSVVKALGQISSRGKLVAQEANQLAQVGINVRQIFAEELKEAGNDFGNMAITIEETLERITSYMETAWGGVSLAKMQTFEGRLSNLTDAWQRFVYEVMTSGGAFEYIKKIITDMTGLLDDITSSSQSMREFGEIIDGVVKGVVEGFSSAYEDIKSFFGLFFDFESFDGESIADAISSIVRVVTDLVVIMTTVLPLVASFALVGQLFQGVFNIMDKGIDIIQSLYGSWRLLSANWTYGLGIAGKLKVAINALTIANMKAQAATALLSIQQMTLGGVMTATGSAVVALTVKIKAMSVAMLTSPIGLFAALAGILVAGWSMATSTIENVEKAVGEMNKEVDKSNKILNAYNKDMANSGSEEDRIEANKNLKESMEAVAKAGGRLSKEAKAVADSINGTTGSLFDGGRALKEYKNAIDKLDIKAFRLEMARMKISMEDAFGSQFVKDMKGNWSGLSDQITGELSDINNAMDESTRKQKEAQLNALSNMKNLVSGQMSDLIASGKINLDWSKAELQAWIANNKGIVGDYGGAWEGAFDDMTVDHQGMIDKVKESSLSSLEESVAIAQEEVEKKQNLLESLQDSYDKARESKENYMKVDNKEGVAEQLAEEQRIGGELIQVKEALKFAQDALDKSTEKLNNTNKKQIQTLEDLRESEENYVKVVGTERQKGLYEIEKSYEKAKEAVEKYYASEEDRASVSGARLLDIRKSHAEALAKLEKDKQKEMYELDQDNRDKVIESFELLQDQKRVILEESLSNQVITQEEHSEGLLKIENESNAKLVQLMTANLAEVADVYDRDSSQYREALKDKLKADENYYKTKTELATAQADNESKLQGLRERATELSYKQELSNLKKLHTEGLISKEAYEESKRQIEVRMYTEKLRLADDHVEAMKKKYGEDSDNYLDAVENKMDIEEKLHSLIQKTADKIKSANKELEDSFSYWSKGDAFDTRGLGDLFGGIKDAIDDMTTLKEVSDELAKVRPSSLGTGATGDITAKISRAVLEAKWLELQQEESEKRLKELDDKRKAREEKRIADNIQRKEDEAQRLKDLEEQRLKDLEDAEDARIKLAEARADKLESIEDKYLSERISAQEAYASTIEQITSDLSGKIQSLEEGKVSFSDDIESRINELSGAVDSGADAYVTVIAKAEAKFKEAQAQQLEGNFEKALQSLEEGANIAEGLAGQTAKLESGRLVTQKESTLKSMQLLQQASDLQIELSDKQIAKEKEVAASKIKEEHDAFAQSLIRIDAQKTALDALAKSLSDIESVKEIDVVINYQEKNRPAALTDSLQVIKGYNQGGFIRKMGQLAGFGGGDKVKALLEKGEFVVRKEAVKALGTGFLHKVNNLQLDIPRFQTGGMVGDAGASVNVTDSTAGGMNKFILQSPSGREVQGNVLGGADDLLNILEEAGMRAI